MHWRGGVLIEREGMRERKERGRKKSSVAQQNPYLLQARRKELRSNKNSTLLVIFNTGWNLTSFSILLWGHVADIHRIFGLQKQGVYTRELQTRISCVFEKINLECYHRMETSAGMFNYKATHVMSEHSAGSLPLPIDICNPRKVTSVLLPTSWIGMRYLEEGKRSDGERRGVIDEEWVMIIDKDRQVTCIQERMQKPLQFVTIEMAVS
ncbi:hypothetical protein EVAR_22184_1 [Eumeta japonica]|uniref:Uncharacterized protein n=1 Tax=Eumeta variegata TaxID=151549 RepID=A0A4C1XYZ8_EUMVA|nr:hypothetical protein EVAR_22184_1 [Eumeta japonica]